MLKSSRALVLIAAFLQAASLASAGTVVQKLNFSNTGPLSFAPFDSSLGTLTGIEIRMASELSNGTVTLTDNQDTTATNVRLDSGVTLTESWASSPLITQSLFFNYSDNTGYTVPKGKTGITFTQGGNYPGFTSTLSQTTGVTSSDFSNYTGSALLSFDLGITTTDAFTAADKHVISTHTGTTSGSVIVSYTYTPAGVSAVPEPASLAMIGTGLLGLGWFGRTRLKKR